MGGRGDHAPPRPWPCKNVMKKMAAKGSRIDFMFLGPPYPAAGSATGLSHFPITVTGALNVNTLGNDDNE